MTRRPRVVVDEDPPMPDLAPLVCFLHGSYVSAECPICLSNQAEREAAGDLRRDSCPRCEMADVLSVVILRYIMKEWVGVCPKGHAVSVKGERKKR